MALSIGLIHLLKHLPKLLAPFLLSYVTLDFGLRQIRPGFPTLHPIVILASIPVYLVLSSLYVSFRDNLAASRRGAVLPASVESSFAGLSIARALARRIKEGYPSTNVLSTLFLALLNVSTIGDFFLELSEKYGHTYIFPVLWDNRIFTTEPNHIKAILATQFDDFEKGPSTGDRFDSLLGTGVFNSDGERWKFHRSMTRPFFSKDRISHFDVFDRHAEDALHQAKIRLASGYPIDFQDMVSRFTLDSATEFLFGQDVRSLSAGLEYPRSSPLSVTASNPNHPANVFAEAFIEGQNLTARRSSRGLHWPLFEWDDKVKPHRDIVNGFIDPIISAAIERYTARIASGQTSEKDTQEGETLLDHLVKTTQDHQILQDEILNIMIAGRDTTACLLTYAVYMLAENPHVLHKLRSEVLSHVGASQRPDFDDLRNMKYLRAFINETLRLYPPVPFDGRTSRGATTLPPTTPGERPFYVPPSTTCLYSVFIMHRREDLWGPDASTFDPERFLDERVKLVTKNPYMFLPFNGGPRICLGQQFAYHEASFFLIKLLQKFSTFALDPIAQPASFKPPADWAKCPGTKGTEKVVPGVHLTMFVKGGLWIRMGESNAERA